MEMDREKRMAFTLVEILVALLLIAVLAGAMMLVSFSVTSKATATRILEDMRSMKSAAVLYHADYGKWPVWMKSGTTILDINGNAGPDRYLEKIPIARDHWIGVAGTSTEKAEATVIFVSISVNRDTLAQLQSLGHPLPLYGMRITGRLSSIPENPASFDAATHNAALWFIRKAE
jgi:general secretion pathway protein G